MKPCLEKQKYDLFSNFPVRDLYKTSGLYTEYFLAFFPHEAGGENA